MKEIKSLTPFKHMCMTIGNLPSSYVDSMSYYECLMWLCKFLQEEVIPTVNNNSEVVKELQEYVKNYFDNLDVQDEINNKLDEMSESGELQEIISEYLNSKAIFGYNTVSEMQQATNLINGSYAKTLGYYSKNDGGNGLYKIRNITNDDIVDGGSIIEMNDNNLVAELIIENEINIKQFGAYGDGIHDDTNSFKKCIEYVKNKTILIPDGNYLISETLTILDKITIKGINGVPKIKYNSTGALFLIKGHIKNEEDSNTNVVKEEKSPILSNIVLWCNGIQEGNFYGVPNTIGIKYDTTTGLTNARTFINDVNIEHFDIGIEFSNLNCYILTYNRVSLTRNNIAVLCPANQTNSGERMSFNDCILDSNKIGCKFLGHGYDLHFINCSIDYNICFLHSLVSVGSRMVDLNGCHYETKYTGDDSIPHGFLWGVMVQSQLNISNSMIFTKVTEKQFNKNGMNGTLSITITGSRIMYWDEDYYKFDLNHMFFALNDDIVQASCNEQGYSDMGLPFNFTNSLTTYPAFNRLTLGTAHVSDYMILDSANKSSHITMTGATNVGSYEITNVPEIGMQGLKAIPSDNSSECILTLRNSQYLDYKSLMYFAIACKNVDKFRYRAIYYDVDKNIISTDDFKVIDTSSAPLNTLTVVPRGYRTRQDLSKINVKYVRFELQIRNGSNTSYSPELCCFMPYTI